MLQSGSDFDLSEEPVAAQRGGQLRSEHLDRDLAVVSHVLGEVDRGHAALPELALEHVAVAKSVS